MRPEAITLLSAIRAYNVAHDGDSDDVEIDAAFEMEEAALALVREVAVVDPEVATLLENFESRSTR